MKHRVDHDGARGVRGKDLVYMATREPDGTPKWKLVEQSYRVRCSFDLADRDAVFPLYRNSNTLEPSSIVHSGKRYLVYFEGPFESSPLIEVELERLLVIIADPTGRVLWEDPNLAKDLDESSARQVGILQAQINVNPNPDRPAPKKKKP